MKHHSIFFIIHFGTLNMVNPVMMRFGKYICVGLFAFDKTRVNIQWSGGAGIYL